MILAGFIIGALAVFGIGWGLWSILHDLAYSQGYEAGFALGEQRGREALKLVEQVVTHIPETLKAELEARKL